MVGLGRAVGAGGDMVILGIVGQTGAAGPNVCVHLEATFDVIEELDANAGELCG